MGLFRRAKRDASEVSRDDVLAMLPASVREPDRTQILTPMLDAIDPASDEDLRFLESLVDSVEQQRPAPKPPRTPAPSRMALPREDDAALEFFREMQDEREQREPLSLSVPDVQMDDLVEELSMTAAALRLRKAA